MQDQMTQWKDFRDCPYDYSLYVHGFLEPWIRQQRSEGKFVKGKYVSLKKLHSVGEKDIQDGYGEKWTYVGEIDSVGRACGRGVAR